MISIGCSSKQNSFEGFAGRQRSEGFSNRPVLDDAQRQEMFEQMQKISIAACQNKQEGDSCQMENFRNTEGPVMEGTCKYQEDSLICEFERPARSFDRFEGFSDRSMMDKKPEIKI